MPRQQYPGQCDSCGVAFDWYPIHNGFDNSFYAYCSGCGTTAILDFYGTPLTQHPAVAKLPTGEIPQEIEYLLQSCSCGSRFQAGAKPRCPRCAHELLPRAGANGGSSSVAPQRRNAGWPLTWNPAQIYCIFINDKVVNNPFRQPSAT
jgi:putative hemolysin